MKPQKSSVAPTSGSLSMTPAAVATNEDQSKARIPTGPVIPIAAPRDSEEKEETSTSVSSRVHEIQKPELSKNVRKVFGDDEESIPE